MLGPLLGPGVAVVNKTNVSSPSWCLDSPEGLGGDKFIMVVGGVINGVKKRRCGEEKWNQEPFLKCGRGRPS